MRLSSKAWVKLPLVLKQLPGITKAAADVGAIIVHHCQSGSAAITAAEIAAAIGYDPKTVKRSVYALEAAGLLIVQRVPGSASMYTLTDRCKELCASALSAPGAKQQRDSSSSSSYRFQKKGKKPPLTQAEIAELDEYLNLPPLPFGKE